MEKLNQNAEAIKVVVMENVMIMDVKAVLED
jgi:hypothetical protein